MYSLNLGKCNSCLTYHSSRQPYCAFSIHISLHHTCASLSYLISFIPNWYYYHASYQKASQYIKYMHSSVNTHKPNQHASCKLIACTLSMSCMHMGISDFWILLQGYCWHPYDKPHRDTQHQVSLSVETL